MPEIWHSENASINDIISYRSRMIYSRFVSSIKPASQSRFLSVMQEVAIASKPTNMEFKLEKKPSAKMQIDNRMPIIGNPAPLKSARFQENIKTEKKVDYLVNDTDVKATTAMKELYKASISVSSIIKILSAGLLGEKKNRKLVPTRWAITATDSSISNEMIDKIRYYPIISDYLLFNSEYLGNHYEIFLIPSTFSYEVIEAKMSGSIWNPSSGKADDCKTVIMQDYENWYGRKDYAENVGGGYYAPRLAISEYLSAIKRQAAVLVLRECRPEYWAPCGVGILRECTRSAMRSTPEHFSTLSEAFGAAQKRMRLPIKFLSEKSMLLKNVQQQKKLSSFF